MCRLFSQNVNPTRCLNTIVYCVGVFKRKSNVYISPLQRSDVPDVASVCDILGYRLVAQIMPYLAILSCLIHSLILDYRNYGGYSFPF